MCIIYQFSVDNRQESRLRLETAVSLRSDRIQVAIDNLKENLKLLSNGVLVNDLLAKMDSGAPLSDVEMADGAAEMEATMSTFPNAVSAAFVDKLGYVI